MSRSDDHYPNGADVEVRDGEATVARHRGDGALTAITSGAAVSIAAAVTTGAATSAVYDLLNWALHAKAAAHLVAFYSSAVAGGIASGLVVAAVWPRRNAFLAAAGPLLFWVSMISANPWMRRGPLVWLEAAVSILAALAAWSVLRFGNLLPRPRRDRIDRSRGWR